MAIPQSVLDLIDRFERNHDDYRSPNYNEARLRTEFLDPLFESLGWDIHNTIGNAETYKDVIHEDSLPVDASTKAPDYCFQIGGLRKFFVEAKKPAINIQNDTSPAYQLRRYAWSAKLPLSILSDFEEFAVYDTRVKPEKDDKASTARLLYIKYTEYADRWDEIANIFSKDAIYKGSFDRYADSTRQKRGTALVDDAFLAEIESWRDQLARNIALRNPRIGQRELNFAVQTTIDRIIFLRICEGRGIEKYGALMALQNGKDVYQRLMKLFHDADFRYNSGLFHFERESNRDKPDTITPGLVIDDRVLKDILKRLYYPESPYEFAMIPADILGQVYERFLGKVIRLTPGGQAKVEEKPEVRKAGGVYYTPTYIVDYIVKHTVGKLVDVGDPPTRSSSNIPSAHNVDVGDPPTRSSSRKPSRARKQAVSSPNPDNIKNLRILDPACGSGSFLLVAYQFLLDWFLAEYKKSDPEQLSKKRKSPLFKDKHGEWRLTPSERKRILLAHIYGVDIDSQAVEVTKLSLLLKVLEGENEEALKNQLVLLHERALPDLDNNIKCGNSLIGPDFYANTQLTMLTDDEAYRINAFDWKKEFPEVFKGDNPGFDAVIGNPPYGAYFSEKEKEYLNAKFKNHDYQLDSYILFLEQAFSELLKAKGLYGMIIPNPWLTNLLQKHIRLLVTNNSKIHEIVHFRFPVFPKVTVDTEVIILENSIPLAWTTQVLVIQSLEAFAGQFKTGFTKILHSQEKWQALDGAVINIFTSPEEEALAAKCLHSSTALSSFCMIHVGVKPYQTGKGDPAQTPDIVKNRPFDSNRKTDAFYKAYLRGADISRYAINPVEPRFIKYGVWLAEPRPSAGFEAPIKIIMRQTGDSLVAALDTKQYLCLNNMHVIVPNSTTPSAKYLLGVINSSLLNWYYHILNPEVGEALAEVKKANVAKLPIRPIDFSNPSDRKRHDRMVDLVTHMLDLHKKLPSVKTPHEKETIQRQIDATDRQIDLLVYELYELTEEEIGIVEESK